MTLKDEPPTLAVAQSTTGEDQRNSSRKTEEAEPKQKGHPAVDVSGGESKLWSYKERYCIGTWNIRPMNQGKFDVVKQGLEKVNTDILEISETKWTGMGKLNLDNHCIYYSG